MPMRQGKHLPQDSYWQKATSARVISTTQLSSSAAMMPPEAEDGPGGAQNVEVQHDVHVVSAEDAAQRPAGLQELQFLAAADAAGGVVQHVL